MPVTSGKTILLSRDGDFKNQLMSAIGDISSFRVMNNNILVLTFVQPETSKGGIIKTQQTLDEDQYQGKVGLVIKVGPRAYVDDDKTKFHGEDISVGDFVLYRASSGMGMLVKGVHCRMFKSEWDILARVSDPEVFW